MKTEHAMHLDKNQQSRCWQVLVRDEKHEDKMQRGRQCKHRLDEHRQMPDVNRILKSTSSVEKRPYIDQHFLIKNGIVAHFN